MSSLTLNVAFSLKNSLNVLFVFIAVSIDKFTKVRGKNHNAKHKEHSLIENPIKPFSVCDLTHVDFGFSCEREIRTFRNQCRLKTLISRLGVVL